MNTLPSIDTIAVYYIGGQEKCLVGRLRMDGRRPVFGYEAAWLADGLPLSPIEMPLSNGQQLYYDEHASMQYRNQLPETLSPVPAEVAEPICHDVQRNIDRMVRQ